MNLSLKFVLFLFFAALFSQVRSVFFILLYLFSLLISNTISTRFHAKFPSHQLLVKHIKPLSMRPLLEANMNARVVLLMVLFRISPPL
jgi:hypothetical protein